MAICALVCATLRHMSILRALEGRLELYENTRVLSVENHIIQTEQAKVRAKYIIFTCHYPFVNVPGFYFARMHQERSYVLALEQAAALQECITALTRTGTHSVRRAAIS